jgi:phosphatidylserine decarboxylase
MNIGSEFQTRKIIVYRTIEKDPSIVVKPKTDDACICGSVHNPLINQTKA